MYAPAAELIVKDLVKYRNKFLPNDIPEFLYPHGSLSALYLGSAKCYITGGWGYRNARAK